MGLPFRRHKASSLFPCRARPCIILPALTTYWYQDGVLCYPMRVIVVEILSEVVADLLVLRIRKVRNGRCCVNHIIIQRQKSRPSFYCHGPDQIFTASVAILSLVGPPMGREAAACVAAYLHSLIVHV